MTKEQRVELDSLMLKLRTEMSRALDFHLYSAGTETSHKELESALSDICIHSAIALHIIRGGKITL